MGLFINESQHPTVFKNTGELNAVNQVECRSDYLSELVKEQQASNKSFHVAINGIRNAQYNFDRRQSRQWNEIKGRLSELKELNAQHEKMEHLVIDWLEKLENQNKKLQMIMMNEKRGKKT